MFKRLRRKDPTQRLASMLFYEACYVVVQAIFILVYRMRRFVEAPVPQEGPLLIVVNHQSFLDPPLVGLSIRNRHPVYLARHTLFKNRLFAWLLRALNAVPIKEQQGDAAAIRTAIELLRAGRCLVIFPEGSRSEDGAMAPFKRGAWLLLSRAKCDVLPVAVEGCFDAWPRHRRMPSLLGKRVASKVGTVVRYDDLIAMGPDAGLAHLAQIVDRMRMELREHLRAASAGKYPPRGPADAAEPKGRVAPTGA